MHYSTNYSVLSILESWLGIMVSTQSLLKIMSKAMNNPLEAFMTKPRQRIVENGWKNHSSDVLGTT
jgi:hypothetical protein